MTHHCLRQQVQSLEGSPGSDFCLLGSLFTTTALPCSALCYRALSTSDVHFIPLLMCTSLVVSSHWIVSCLRARIVSCSSPSHQHHTQSLLYCERSTDLTRGEICAWHGPTCLRLKWLVLPISLEVPFSGADSVPLLGCRPHSNSGILV